MAKSMELLNVNLDEKTFDLIKKILARKLRERGCSFGGSGGPVLSVAVHDALTKGAYRVEPDKIFAGDINGILSGLGRYLNECRFDGYGAFIPAEGVYELVPKKPVRGMYFASHFFNFYHSAPIEKVYEIVEDLALRGCNALMAWYDMHHYTGVNDPESIKMIDRLKKIYLHAKALGFILVTGGISNEAYDGTPDRLKANWLPVNGYKRQLMGHYHVEICPSAEGGMEEILRQRREMLTAFADIPFDYYSIGPYDQGGCTCADCKPWGANGYLRIAPKIDELLKEIMPGARMLCFTWFFDSFIDGEWDAFYERMKEPQFEFFAYLFGYFFSAESVPEFIRNGDMPGGKQMLSFSEISMHGAVPWGGFGTNPLPKYLEELETANGWFYQGGFPYSEGIYEDINKALTLGFVSGQYAGAKEILNDYARFEFCAAPEEIVSLIYDMEDTLVRHRYDEDGEIQDYPLRPMPPGTRFKFVFDKPEKIDDIYERANRIDVSLAPSVRSGWRWRVVFLRACIDYELYHNDGEPNEQCEIYYNELIEMYYAQEALYALAPPTRENMDLCRGGYLL